MCLDTLLGFANGTPREEINARTHDEDNKEESKLQRPQQNKEANIHISTNEAKGKKKLEEGWITPKSRYRTSPKAPPDKDKGSSSKTCIVNSFSPLGV